MSFDFTFKTKSTDKKVSDLATSVDMLEVGAKVQLKLFYGSFDANDGSDTGKERIYIAMFGGGFPLEVAPQKDWRLMSLDKFLYGIGRYDLKGKTHNHVGSRVDALKTLYENSKNLKIMSFIDKANKEVLKTPALVANVAIFFSAKGNISPIYTFE